MTHTISRAARAIGLGAAALGMVSASLVLAQPSSASPGGPAAPTLDHFLCYQAKGTGYHVPKNVLLFNQVQPNPFAPRIGNVAMHCNPANKQVPKGFFKAVLPKDHLLCWAIQYPNFAKQPWSLTNQFGQGIMTVNPPSHLCLPTWKSLRGPPKEKTKAPPGLDHFTCYPLTQIPGSYAFSPPPTRVEDEFSYPKFVSIKIGIADLLCVPTTKIVNGVAYKPQSPTDKSLMCFPEFVTPIKPRVFDLNQFGTGRVAPTRQHERLCLPTVIQPVGGTA